MKANKLIELLSKNPLSEVNLLQDGTLVAVEGISELEDGDELIICSKEDLLAFS